MLNKAGGPVASAKARTPPANHDSIPSVPSIVETELSADLIIVGAGAVGLFLAFALARRGISVILLEKRKQRDAGSRAIGISSPSLALLAAEGILEPFVAEGVTVRGALVSDGRRELGRLDFASVGGPFPFVLSLPQARTEAILEELVRREPLIRYCPGIEATGFADAGRMSGPEAGRAPGGERGVGESGEGLPLGKLAILSARDEAGCRRLFGAELVVACDGKRGLLGPASGLAAKGHSYRDRFLMGDFVDYTNWNNDARLFFTPSGSVESFPLPGGMRRWVLSCEVGGAADGGLWLSAKARARTGTVLEPAAMRFESAFGVERRIQGRWASGRLFVAGDAAHLMSPIVGQNMNTGFADALWLAGALEELFRAGGGGGRSRRGGSALDETAIERLGRAYARSRRAPARAAANRAWAMMRLGTARGGLVSGLRSTLVAAALSGPAAKRLAGIFTMRSIPGGRG